MPPKNERHKIRNQHKSESVKPITLEDYEKHLLDSILKIERDIQDSLLDHRVRRDDRIHEIRKLSSMHQHLRNFQLNQ